MAMPVPKVVLLPALIFSLFKTQTIVCVNFTTFMATKQTSAFSPAPIRKTVAQTNPYGSAAKLTHATATAMNFPANAGLNSFMYELTKDWYLVDTGATLSIVPCTSNAYYIIRYVYSNKSVLF
jgi:hypothetical protein